MSGVYARMWRLGVLFVIAVMSLAASDCEQTNRVFGMASVTNRPLAGATFRLESPRHAVLVATNFDGSFEVRNLHPGEYSIRLEGFRVRYATAGGLRIPVNGTGCVEANLVFEPYPPEDQV